MNSFFSTFELRLENFLLNFFSITSLIKKFAKKYNKVAPQVNPITAIKEPIQVPNINPDVKTIGSPKPNIKTQIIVNKKNKVKRIKKFCSFNDAR